MKTNQKQKRVILGAALAVLVVGGAVGVNNHNEQVEAAQTALQEKQVYNERLDEVNKAIDKAYETRSDKDIKLVEHIIKKLNDKDQKGPKEKLATLRSLLNQVKQTEQLLTTAEKTMKDKDLANAQKSIDGEKDKYLEKDKQAHQKRLDQLKKAISDQKAKEKAEKDKQAKEKAEQEKAQQASTVNQEANLVREEPTDTPKQAAEVPAPEANVAAPEAENEGSQANAPSYEAPATEVPQYQAPEPQTPVTPAPAQPAQPQAPQAQQPSIGGGRTDVPLGGMTQEQLDESAKEQTDPREDPNSPWFHK